MLLIAGDRDNRCPHIRSSDLHYTTPSTEVEWHTNYNFCALYLMTLTEQSKRKREMEVVREGEGEREEINFVHRI